MVQKPKWAIDRDKARRKGPEPVWLFGLHAVRDALTNPARRHERLVLTRNAAAKLEEAVAAAGLTPEMADPRRFPVPLDPGSVHQGAALLTYPFLIAMIRPYKGYFPLHDAGLVALGIAFAVLALVTNWPVIGPLLPGV